MQFIYFYHPCLNYHCWIRYRAYFGGESKLKKMLFLAMSVFSYLRKDVTEETALASRLWSIKTPLWTTWYWWQVQMRCTVWYYKAHLFGFQNPNKHAHRTIIITYGIDRHPPRVTRQPDWPRSDRYTHAEHFLSSSAAVNAPHVPSLTPGPGILTVANAVDQIFLGQGNVLELENNPFSFNQDHDKCFNCESGDRYRAFHKENCLFSLSPGFFVNLCRWHKGGREEKQFSGRQVIIWRLADRQQLLLL